MGIVLNYNVFKMWGNKTCTNGNVQVTDSLTDDGSSVIYLYVSYLFIYCISSFKLFVYTSNIPENPEKKKCRNFCQKSLKVT